MVRRRRVSGPAGAGLRRLPGNRAGIRRARVTRRVAGPQADVRQVRRMGRSVEAINNILVSLIFFQFSYDLKRRTDRICACSEK